MNEKPIINNIAPPFLRQVEVLVGPLPEASGGGPEKESIRFFGDGTTNNLRIKFQIQKPYASSSVSIYNLGPDLRNRLHTRAVQTIVRAGWQSTELIEIFKGSMLASFSTRQGADLVTELVLYAAYFNGMETISEISLSEGASLRSEVIRLANQLGVVVNSDLIDINDVTIPKNGLTNKGTTLQMLDWLARNYGFTCYVDMGVFYAKKDKGYFSASSSPLISGKSGYLLRAEPMVSSPVPYIRGISISSLFFPDVKPFRLVRLDSYVNPNINGEYIAKNIIHSGDTHSNHWNTEIQAWVKGEAVEKPSISFTQFTDTELIAGTMIGEAEDQKQNARLAVGMTIQTRVEHPTFWGHNWRQVILKPGEFSCWTQGLDRIIKHHNDQTALWKECMGFAQQIQDGKKFNVGLLGLPTNFYDDSISMPKSWNASRLTYIGTIGRLLFYSEKGLL